MTADKKSSPAVSNDDHPLDPWKVALWIKFGVHDFDLDAIGPIGPAPTVREVECRLAPLAPSALRLVEREVERLTVFTVRSWRSIKGGNASDFKRLRHLGDALLAIGRMLDAREKVIAAEKGATPS
jgi:hypothetical protein